MPSNTTVDVRNVGVVLVTVHGAPDLESWAEYEGQYLAALALTPTRVVLVFDLTQAEWDVSSLPPIVAKKLALTRRVKALTIQRVQAVMVLTGSPLLAEVVTSLVQASGQTSPFFCVDTWDECRALLERLRCLAVRTWWPMYVQPRGTGGPTVGSTPRLVLYLLLARAGLLRTAAFVQALQAATNQVLQLRP